MARLPDSAWYVLALLFAARAVVVRASEHELPPQTNNLSLWIDEQQVKMISGFQSSIHLITEGMVMSYILDKNFEKHLPVIPPEISYVNFTWMSGNNKYYYIFHRLHSDNNEILKPPTVTIKTKGKIPKKPKVFSLLLPCSGNNSGVVGFSIRLIIRNKTNDDLPDTPLQFKLKKECELFRNTSSTPDLECDKKCQNNGWCDAGKICQCPEGYMGQYCKTALCYPQCMNNGTCIAPGVCQCLQGFQGPYCEGGICVDNCLNGGKCIQKDTCQCPKGFYGLRCEYSKCIIPCLNGGKCKGVNKCRCMFGFQGDHCEIGQPIKQYYDCKPPCRHGYCTENKTCICKQGWFGKLCKKKVKHLKRKP